MNTSLSPSFQYLSHPPATSTTIHITHATIKPQSFGGNTFFEIWYLCSGSARGAHRIFWNYFTTMWLHNKWTTFRCQKHIICDITFSVSCDIFISLLFHTKLYWQITQNTSKYSCSNETLHTHIHNITPFYTYFITHSINNIMKIKCYELDDERHIISLK